MRTELAADGVLRPRSRVRLAGLAALFVLGSVPSCGSDRPSLALRPHAGAGGQGAVAQGGGGRGGALTRPPVAGGGGVNPDKHVEPPGRSVFTLVHGIVDADLSLFCFARVRDGETKLVGRPVPAGGLAYGASLSFETLEGVDAERDGVAPFVITGDLSEVEGLDCADAVARAEAVMQAARGGQRAEGGGGQGGEAGAVMAGGGGAAGDAAGAAGAEPAKGTGGTGGTAPASDGQGGEAGAPELKVPALRVGGLPGLPAGALAAGYSLLEVADGCLGAEALTDRLERQACGDDYTPEHGSLTAELVVLARETASGALALQALHASRGSGDLGLSTEPAPGGDGLAMTLIDDFGEGALRPRDPRADLPSSSWGVNTDTWSMAATMNGVTYASDLWSTIRERSGIDELENGRGYTVIALGPNVAIAHRGFWNDFALTLVDNDPPVR